MRLFRRKVRQTCWAYCPNCKRDLCSNPDAHCEDTDLGRYVCSCGESSAWDFDAPAPLLISHEATHNPIASLLRPRDPQK
jgi:hypothetical protein